MSTPRAGWPDTPLGTYILTGPSGSARVQLSISSSGGTWRATASLTPYEITKDGFWEWYAGDCRTAVQEYVDDLARSISTRLESMLGVSSSTTPPSSETSSSSLKEPSTPSPSGTPGTPPSLSMAAVLDLSRSSSSTGWTLASSSPRSTWTTPDLRLTVRSSVGSSTDE